MKIQKLPVEAICKLQSGIIVTDAVQVVLELVRNSLDAEATGISVRIDLKSYQIRVIDNGKGIDKDDLKFVGERFMTSKFHPSVNMGSSLPTYGFRGQALSSLQDVSKCLKIETKSEEGGPTFVKVFQNNKASPITESDNDRSGTGTTVTIDDFMFTMPVRRKRISEVFDMEEIKTQLQYLAIIHFNVCFTLRNENKALILLQTPQASNILEAVTNIYGRTLAKSLMPLHCEEKKYEVTGFISLKPQAQNSIQLLYINRRIVSKGVVHKFMNSVIKEYRGKQSLVGDSLTDQVLKKLKSSCNAFIVQINCPHSYYELFTNGRKVTVEFRNWKDALKCVQRAVKRAFKDISNSDNSSTSQHDDEKNKTEKQEEERKVFSTSLLVNAVRGAPAKRCCKNRSAKIKNKIKVSDSKEKSEMPLSKISKNTDGSLESGNNLKKTAYQNEFSNDSLESPIPKKLMKKVKSNCDLNSKKTIINQSFVEFYEWLKVKFETDTNAYDLYNEFLKFKSAAVHSHEVTQFESPVLGGKLKRKQAPNYKNKQKTPANNLSLLDEEMAVVTQQQLKIFPNQPLRLRKSVQFTTDTGAHIPETLNLGCIRSESLSFEKHSNQVFKKPESVPVWRNEKQIEYNHTLQSLPSSEVQFTNIIKFRNLSESFFHRNYDVHDLLEKTFSASNTWVSHYQDVVSGGAEFSCGKQEFRNVQRNVDQHDKMYNFVAMIRENEEATIGKNKDLGDFDFFNGSNRPLGLVEYANRTRSVIAHDVGVQVNMSNLPAQKINVMVQTFQEVPESTIFESSYVLSQGIAVTGIENAEVNPEADQQKELLRNSLSQDVPIYDFWNSSAQLRVEQSNNQQEYISAENELIPNNDSLNQKNLTSNDFFCGHKSQLSTKGESTSKETQTLAVIWTDSLTELEYPPENVSTVTKNLNKSKSEDTHLSESNTIPQTIPIEEVQCYLTEQIESVFCVTERHDFVPKGLSPKFLNPETTKVTSLSPSEKCKIKLTVDDIQNEFLATIKWQDESTGDLIKPSIPDGIIFEMRRKAGEDVVNYENPVLSAALSYCAVKVHNLLHSFAFTKDLLSGVEVLGQLDKKFIVTKINISTPKKMELISLFDQHAVDERIKLEELINGNVSPEGKFLSSRLNPPVECKLIESDVRVVSDLKEKLQYFGISAKEINGSTLSVNEIPIFLLKKHENDLKNKKENSLSDVVKALILNIIEEVRKTRGTVSNIPKIMHNAFCLEACHKAVKFNKSLSKERMTEMITQLQNCKLPFQCAHGRPSVIPIIDIEDFRTMMEESDILDLQKLKEFLKERGKDSAVGSCDAV